MLPQRHPSALPVDHPGSPEKDALDRRDEVAVAVFAGLDHPAPAEGEFLV
jgi:hypothetical protein